MKHHTHHHTSDVHGSGAMHSFTKTHKEIIPMKQMIILFVVAIIMGSMVGFGISRFTSASSSSSSSTEAEGGDTVSETPQSAGIVDKELFPDEAEGKLKKGGIEGEGTHHLERPGGESQNVYLTSSAVDLSLFEGKKVKIMGKTYTSEKAGWFMDVGYIELK